MNRDPNTIFGDGGIMLTLPRNVVHTETDYGAVLLDAGTGRYWTLNPTGALVVRVLLGGGSIADAADAVAGDYEVDAATASQDVDILLAQLREAGLITTSPDKAFDKS
jgi:hypothetical protein